MTESHTPRMLGDVAPRDATRRDAAPRDVAPRVNGDRLLHSLRELAAIGRTAAGGVNRLAYSDEDVAARTVVRQWMREAGLETRVDAGGNTVGVRPPVAVAAVAAGAPGRGVSDGLAPIVIGSHTDTVPDGGRFDGALGVLAAIEVARTLHEQGIALRHPLEVVDFQNEEGGLVGSKIATGRFDVAALSLVATSGRTIGDGISRLGGDPARLDDAIRPTGSIAAYVELHIEQGRELERAGVEIGVVEGLVGIRYWEVTFEGVASHAGTTAMPDRHDALLAAARFVDAVHRVVTSTAGRHVGTVGQLRVHPGGANVIPGRVVLTLELRDLQVATIESLFSRIRAEGEAIARGTGTRVSFVPGLVNDPSPTDPRVRDTVSAAAASLGLRTLALPSGAGHDAQNMAGIGPAGMLFVPSVDGISHSPRELTRDGDLVNGANVLLATVLQLDRVL